MIKLGLNILLLLFVHSFSWANEPEWAAEKSKTLEFSFAAKNLQQVSISNKFGNVEVRTWDKAQVKATVTLKAHAANNTLAEKYLNNIQIQHNVANHNLSFLTSMKEGTQLISVKRVMNISVNYVVYLPKHLKLHIDNVFGDILLPAFYAPLSVNLQHGDLKAPIIHNPESLVNMRFGSAFINELNGASLQSTNSNIQLIRALNADLKMEKGEFNAKLLENIKAELNYTRTTLQELSKNIELQVKYVNDLNINSLNNDLKQLIINSNYSDIQLPILPEFSSKINIQTINGHLYMVDGSGLKIDKKSENNNVKVFKVSPPNTNPPKRDIQIKVNNGDLKIKP